MNEEYLPISRRDLERRGWTQLDIILVTGDAYVDHPSYGMAVVGRVLESAGFRVGIIAQPNWRSMEDFLKIGRPRLFFGVTAGNLDSMLSNYTANKRPRNDDEYSPGGRPGQRPDRASIVYTNRCKAAFPGVPVVIGGIEASLRRLAHYDYWSDKVRRSLLVDSKADILVYGMAEKQILEIASRLKHGAKMGDIDGVAGTVVIKKELDGAGHYVVAPSFEDTSRDINKFNEAFRIIYNESDPFRGRPIAQRHGDRYVIQYPPAKPLTTSELDSIYDLKYNRRAHPVYDKSGGVPGFETVRDSVISHRGCSGECSFCSLYLHQGRIVQSRSRKSITEEIRRMASKEDFRGTVTDIGGPTVNLYNAKCALWKDKGACRDKGCLFPKKCVNLKLGYAETLKLWESSRGVPGVKHVFIGSGMRHDLLIDDYANEYLTILCKYHVGGQLKVAPEHCSEGVLGLMRKPSIASYEKFARRFNETNARLGKRQFLVHYLISAHPGATLEDALGLAAYFASRHIHPEQIQDYIPLPMTISGAMYYTAKDPFTGKAIHAVKKPRERKLQRALLQYNQAGNRKYVLEALKILKRMDFAGKLLGRDVARLKRRPLRVRLPRP